MSRGTTAPRPVSVEPETHGLRPAATMVIIGGPPGAGKSTVAAALARETGWTVIRSDEIRREVLGGEPWTGSSEWLAAHFSLAATETTYQEMLTRAEGMLAQGRSVIIDATWAAAAHRLTAQRVAARLGGVFVGLLCAAPADVTDSRVGRRIAAGPDISRATVEVARAIAASFDPWPEAISLDTTAGVADTVRVALSVVRDVVAPAATPPPHDPR